MAMRDELFQILSRRFTRISKFARMVLRGAGKAFSTGGDSG